MIIEIVVLFFTICRKVQKRCPRYFGDIGLDDLKDPKKLSKCWKIIKLKVANLQQKLKTLRQSQKRKVDKINNQDALLHYLRSNYLTENASQTIEVRIYLLLGKVNWRINVLIDVRRTIWRHYTGRLLSGMCRLGPNVTRIFLIMKNVFLS